MCRSLLLGLMMMGWIDGLRADAPAEIKAAIEKLGGRVSRIDRDSEDLAVEFQLRGRSLTDAGVARVAELKNIVLLNLRDTNITGEGLVHLKGLTSLRELHLERTAVGDAGMEHLAGLTNLEYLNLYSTQISDKALVHLTGLTKLRSLYVWQTKVTDTGIAKLNKALPNLRVVRGVDLSKLPSVTVRKPSAKPVPLKWIVVAAEKPPKSELGENITVMFENKRKERVKLYWISYGNELKLYAVLEPGAKRRQNSYSRATWLITREDERPLGYFVTTTDEVNLAIIPSK